MAPRGGRAHEEGLLVGLEEDDHHKGEDEERRDDGVGERDARRARQRGDREVLVDVVARGRRGLDAQHMRAQQAAALRHK